MKKIESFGYELKKCRAILRITQKELAEEMGISTSNIRSWEQNKTMPNFENWERLYNFMDREHVGYRLKQAFIEQKGRKNEE